MTWPCNGPSEFLSMLPQQQSPKTKTGEHEEHLLHIHFLVERRCSSNEETRTEV